MKNFRTTVLSLGVMAGLAILGTGVAEAYDVTDQSFTDLALQGSVSEVMLLEASALQVSETEEDTELFNNPRMIAGYVVGHENLTHWVCVDLPMPRQLMDFEGGTIRLIMQHETDGHDQIRVIDEHIAVEHVNDAYGSRGRHNGLYGWTRQSGGGDHGWILGDSGAHTLFNPWGWSHMVDYRWGQGNALLGGNNVRFCSHPHVTTRLIFLD